MIRSLSLANVGPADRLELEFGDRLNLITGDNGLGKSFLLDVSWWALTRHWPHEVNDKTTGGFKALPRDRAKKASISFEIEAKTKTMRQDSTFDRAAQKWTRDPGRPPNPGLVIYAQADGGFSTWDSARNYWKGDVPDRDPAYVFSSSEVWNGLSRDGRSVSEGLLRDWATWQRENGEPFSSLCTALREMSPDGEPLEPGELTQIDLGPIAHPTLRLPYGTVPLVHASAGMRRIIALVYLLVWGWTQHRKASQILGRDPATAVTFLIDEVEAHLHPRWQRRVVRALMNVVEGLHSDAHVQLVVASHSPLVMASVESEFDPERDRWFDLDLEQNVVKLRQRRYERLGSAERWLLSEAFDLRGTGDPKIEEKIRELEGELRSPSFNGRDAAKWHKVLGALLGESDPFWSRWRAFVDGKGWKV